MGSATRVCVLVTATTPFSRARFAKASASSSVRAERPFTKDVLAGIQGRSHEIPVRRHLHGDGHEADLRRGYHLVKVCKGMWDAASLGCSLRACFAGVCHAEDLELVGKHA